MVKAITLKRTFAIAVVLLHTLVSPSFATQTSALPKSLIGHWLGTLVQQEAVLPVSFDFQNRDGKLAGDFTCPAQRCLQYPLDTVTYVAPGVHFVLGDSLTFDGKLTGDIIAGAFQNEGATGKFTGERDHNTPPNERIQNIEQALAKAGNSHYAAILLPGAVHNDTIQPEPGKPFFWWHVAPGLSDVQIGWVRQQVVGKN